MSKVYILLVALPLLATSCSKQAEFLYNDGAVELAGRRLNVQVADQIEEQQQGLSGRAGISENEGMLFIYDRPIRAGFWMKDMLFPIDIVWIREGRVVDLSLLAAPEPGKPDHELKVYFPKTEVDQVLEVAGGWVTGNNLTIGDEVSVSIIDH